MILQIPGYVPIHHLAGRTRRYLNWRLKRWHQSRQSAGALSQLVLSETAKVNLNAISERVALSFIHSKGSLADILTSSGSLVQIDLRTLQLPHEPTYTPNFDVQWFIDLVNFRRVSCETFAADDWQDIVLTSTIYELGSTIKPRCLIDWKHGTMDVSELVKEHAIKEIDNGAGNQRYDLLGGSSGFWRATFSRIPQGNLAKFLPYHGCPVLVPLEWREVLDVRLEDPPEGTCDSLEELEGLKTLPPAKRILAYLSTNPGATKKAVKNAVLPDMTARGFEMHWRNATAERPELSKPGRRPKS